MLDENSKTSTNDSTNNAEDNKTATEDFSFTGGPSGTDYGFIG